jgi:ABC-type dipeptide/oligopeptide/nickel transport system permease component
MDRYARTFVGTNLGWFGAGLVVADLGLILTLATSHSERLWRVFRRPTLLSFQVAGVLLVTWLVVVYAAQSADASVAAQGPAARLGPADTALLARPVGQLILSSARLSLMTMAFALSFASVAGLLGAMAVTSGQRGRWTLLGPVATVLWIAPTFIIAILVQELQAFIYGESGLRVAAGFQEVNPVQVFWVALILAVRPTAYFFQQARNALDLDVTTEYVRTARGKGLAWPVVVRRHILRANAPLILTAWLNSFRSMIGSAPLVEFLFGYPGLGRVLVLALGLSYGTGTGPVHVDVAVGLVVVLALVLISIETITSILERRLDPRLRTIGAIPV